MQIIDKYSLIYMLINKDINNYVNHIIFMIFNYIMLSQIICLTFVAKKKLNSLYAIRFSLFSSCF